MVALGFKGFRRRNMTRLVFNYQISINATPDAVFEYVSDFARHGEWTENLRIEAVSDGPIAVGSEYRSVGKLMGKDMPNLGEDNGIQCA